MAFHTQGQFVDFCGKVFGDYKDSKAGENVSFICPFCKQNKGNRYFNKKLAIHVGNHKLHCWVCHYKSKNLVHILKTKFPNHLDEYLNRFADKHQILEYENQREKEQENERKPIALPDDFQLLAIADRTDPYVIAARNYLKARGALSEKNLWYWRMGISRSSKELRDRIIIPSLNENGVLNYYTGRSISKYQNPKYENPFVVREDVIFNELNIDWNKELILVEGVFDLINCTENATCLLGSALPGHFKLFQKIVENKTPVVLALDPEAIKHSYRIAQSLFEFDVPVRILYLEKDQEDVGSISHEEFKRLLDDAKVFNKNFYLKKRIENIV